jgi:hypothetical protein
MPLFIKAKNEVTKPKEDDNEGKTIFVAKRHWFSLSQTDGLEFVPVIPEFDVTKALTGLNIAQEPFQHMDGNCQGYAKTDQRIIAINPVAYDKPKTIFHEVAHVLLHPGILSRHSDSILPRDVAECEAELTSYLTKSGLRRWARVLFQPAHGRDHGVLVPRRPANQDTADNVQSGPVLDIRRRPEAIFLSSTRHRAMSYRPVRRSTDEVEVAGPSTAVPTTGTLRARASDGDAGKPGTHVAGLDAQNPVRDQSRCPTAAPCRLNDENSRGKLQNVRRNSSVVC